jgi:DNA polymerase-3 subunit gamma/tau
MDVVEIDAASHTGVDNIRELRSNATLRPARSRFKIYIIDEVHMLSTGAFNALLKTLEEPPEHVKFILATTEIQKVPATIQSRCQRFDFRAIDATAISKHLRSIVDREKIKVDDDVLRRIGRLGNGSMRDALSLLDRLMAACPPGDPITVELIEQLLGLPAREQIEALVDAFADADPASALEATDGLVTRGIEIEQFLDSLAQRLRDLMVICACGPETKLVDLAGASRERAVEQARRFDEAGLCHMIALCESVQRSVRASSARRALLDALVVRLSMTEKIASVAALLEGKPSAGAARPKPATHSSTRGSPAKKA